MKNYVVLWSILTSLMLLPSVNSDACYTRGYFFLSIEKTPELLTWDAIDSQYSPANSFLHSGRQQATEGNLEEWKAYFEDKVETDDLGDLIYEIQLEEAEVLASNAKLPQGFSNPAAQTILQSGKGKAFFNYLAYAKRCEPLALNTNWGASLENTNAQPHKQLWEAGIQAYKDSKDNFMRLRYAYQVVRLAHYSKAYSEAVRLYQELVEPLMDEPSIMRYWAMEQMAGALAGLKEQNKANYYFAQVFANAPSRRYRSLTSVRIRGEADWDASMAFCQNDEERAALHAMRAYDKGGSRLGEMEDIVDLAPNLDLMEVMAVEVLKKSEGVLLNSWYHIESSLATRRTYGAEERINVLNKQIKHLLQKSNLAKRAFWQTLYGYTFFLLGDSETASVEFADALSATDMNQGLRQQLEIFIAAMELSMMPKIGPEQEERVAELMTQLATVEKYRSDLGNQYFLRAILFGKYERQNDLAKSYLCQFDETPLLLHPRLDYLNSLLDFVNKPGEMNRLETFLLGKWSREEWRLVLNEIRGTRMLMANKLEEAIVHFDYFAKAQNKPQEQIDRFTAGGKDYNAKPNAKSKEFDLLRELPSLIEEELKKTAIYQKLREPQNKLEVAQALLALQQLQAANPNDWRYDYMLMKAWVEMSYVGSAWRATDYFVNTSRKSPSTYVYRKSEPVYGPPEEVGAYALGNLDNYYEERIVNHAMAAAAKADSDDLGAAIYFELDNYLVFLPNSNTAHFLVRNTIKQNYQDSKYYQEVIQECGAYTKRE